MSKKCPVGGFAFDAILLRKYKYSEPDECNALLGALSKIDPPGEGQGQAEYN
jgi:hypothetical protein